MREVICDTSPLQYLHQLEQLELIPQLASPVLIPRAVAAELAAGLKLGVDLPDPAKLDWATIVEPERSHDLRSSHGLGAGEAEVLALAVEKEAVAILDDRLARRVARTLGAN